MLNHRIDGPDGAPVVLLAPSLGSTLAMWQAQADALAGPFRVVRFDHRGHGASPLPPPPYEIADLGTDVLALLDGLGVARAHVVGLSLGGMVAMWLAAHAPERVDRLVLCSTSARLGPAGQWYDRAATVRRDGMAAIAGAVVGRWFTPDYATTHPDAVAAALAMVSGTDPAGYAACCEAIGRMDQRADLPTITAPTRVLVGVDDPATPPPHAELIADGIPGADLHRLSPGAHLLNVERADEVTALLRDHLEA